MRFEIAARTHISSRGSPGTRALYEADLDRWLAHCRAIGADPDEPELANAVAFRDSLSQGAQTKRRILSALSSMYEAAGIVNHFKSSKRLQRPEADEVALTKEFSKDEVAQLLRVASERDDHLGKRDVAIMRLLYDTGARISAVVALRRDCMYNRPDGQRVVITKVKKKGRVEIEVPKLAADAVDVWLSVAPDSPYVFPRARGTGPLTRRAISQRIADYGKLVGIQNAHPHRFRATFITEAIDAGVPLHEVQGAVHHADPKTTQRYDRHVRGAGVSNALAKYREGK